MKMFGIQSDSEMEQNSEPVGESQNDQMARSNASLLKYHNDGSVKTDRVDNCVAFLPKLTSTYRDDCDALELLELKIKSPAFFDITPDGDEGVKKYTVRPGVGSECPSYGDKVCISYSYWKIVPPICYSMGSLVGRNENFEFVLGKGSVIKALEVVVPTMTVGEEAGCIISPSYAHGDIGSYPEISPDAVVFLEIILHSFWEDDLSLKKDKGILRKCLIKPTGSTSPNEGALVKVQITGCYKEDCFDERELEFNIGEGCLCNIPEGIEIALLKFKQNEKSRLTIAHQYAFGTAGKPENNIPPMADVEYYVTLLHFEKAKEVWEMNTDGKWKHSVEAKEKGNVFFKAGHVKAALKQYKRIVKYLENEPGVAPDEVESRQKFLIVGYLNVALCLLKMNNPMEAVKVCDKVIEIDPTNEKGLYRRGLGYFEVNDFQVALLDFEKLISCCPENKAAQRYVAMCKSEIQKQLQKEKSTYGNMFRRFAEEDEERRKQQQCQTETGVWGGQDRGAVHSGSDDDAIVQMLNKQNLCMTAKEDSQH